MRDRFVCGLVLGAGGSKRLGRAKQLLPYRGGTLLGHVVGTARACRFDQTIVAIGGAADDVRERVDLSGAQVVVNDGYGEGRPAPSPAGPARGGAPWAGPGRVPGGHP